MAGHQRPDVSSQRPTSLNPKPVDFGDNVLIFDPSMSTAEILQKMGQIPQTQYQEASQFATGRYAYFFKPGQYNNLSVEVGYYVTVHGLGYSPDDVTISGGVQSLPPSADGSALNNFWRGVENLAIKPTVNGDINGWAVSQATFLRRVHIMGQLFLWDFRHDQDNPKLNFASGGFIADSAVDVQVISGPQQQFLTRNTALTNWIGGVWNMVFVGDKQPPSGSWPQTPFTVVEKTPVIREKPYLVFDGNNYAVQVPCLKSNSQGTSWSTTPDPVTTIPINQFYIAQAKTDTAASLNTALTQGLHMILTPGIYHLADSLQITHPDTVILGLGMATLIPDNGTPAITVSDVPGVSISGLILDAGPRQSLTLLLVSPTTSKTDHSANPIALFDLSARVGGATLGSTQSCITINAANTLLDNIWLWRADHGNPGTVGWEVNTAAHGIIVNADHVVAYGLFVEHFQQHQTLWTGNGGQTYFYQSETPYDVPAQDQWQQQQQQPRENELGYPSYKVADTVTSHLATGLGVYCNFTAAKIELGNAIETPIGRSGVKMSHMVTRWLNGVGESGINHVINGTGDPVGKLTSFSPN